MKILLSDRAVYQRIIARLHKQGRILRATSKRAGCTYLVIDPETGVIESEYSDLSKLAIELGLINSWESLEVK